MSLKRKISLIISLLFTIIFAFATTMIYTLFSDFRKDEFENRLKEKAVSTIKLLIEVEQVDKQLLKIIDQNTINKLYDEKTLIFDANYDLIYSSIDDTKIQWSKEDLDYLKKNKTFFRKDKEQEIYGFFYDTNYKDYYALVSAKDSYGKRKLEYLFSILLITYIIFTALSWLLTYKMVKKLLIPLDTFHDKIKGINEQNLDSRVAVKEKKDEIDLLADEFNQMLERIDFSYKKQQEFTSNASHELRTPIARLMVQLENKINDVSEENDRNKTFYKTILSDVNRLNELTNSLLILSKNDKDFNQFKENCRMDEIIFDESASIAKQYSDFKFDIDFKEVITLDILGNKSLLLIVFQNLLKNAYLYSESKSVKVILYSDAKQLTVKILNNGNTLSSIEQEKLFEPFMRGENAKSKMGLGLGLRIVQRILSHHKAQVSYQISDDGLNVFKVVFNNI